MGDHLPSTGNGAEVFIETLNTLGIDRVFLNPGIDLVPILAAIARYRESDKRAPKVILCTDESVAVAAAHGYAMVSGKPQMVAVFEDVGTLQGGGAIVNLQYGRMPVIICAGRNAIPNRLNWLDEPFDQRKIVRDYVKWDHEVSANEDISTVLRKAFQIACTEPCGPIYLTLPREILMGKNGDRRVAASIKSDKTSKPGIHVHSLQKAADLLVNSDHPLIMTAYSGRHPQSVPQLLKLAEKLAARVITTDLRMNFPSNHPLCPGMDCIKGDCYDHYIAEADVIFLIDYSFPGPLGKRFEPKQDARIIHFDIEPLKNGSPLWNRAADIIVEGNSSKLLSELNEIVDQRLQPESRQQLRNRFESIEKEHDKIRQQFRSLALNEASKRPISPEWLCHCLNEVLDEDTIIVHQTPSNADAMARHIRRVKPGTIFTWGDNAGSMGWSLPAAFGAKMASPDRNVVSIIGDGGFIYGCPVATLWSAHAYKAPFLTVIFNNQSYAIFKEAMGMIYGERMQSAVSGDLGFELGINIDNPPDFATIAEGCNAYGQTVEDPAEVLPALENGISQVQKGKSAVLDVKIGYS
jgi:acetolactate synthase-1/2/3 large subunit